MRRNLAVAALATLLIGLAALTWWRSGRDVQIEQLHPPLNTSRYEAYLKRIDESPPPPSTVVAPLLRAFAALNRAEVAAADPPTDPAYLAASGAWRRAALSHVQRRGGADFMLVGRRHGLVLAERLAALLAWCRANEVAIDVALRMNDPPPVVRSYVDIGGGFVRFAEQGGLMRDGRLLEQRLPFVQALFMSHWSSALQGVVPVDDHLWPAERRWLLRWRVEYQPGGQLETRLDAADELAAVPDYPAHLNAGVLLYDAGRYREAARRFARSRHPQAVAFRRMAERAAQ